MEKRELPQLIEKYRLQIAITLFFTLLIALTPFFYFRVLPNLQLKILSLRCLILNGLSGVLFFTVEKGKFKELLPFPLAGILLSLLYLKTGSSLLLPPCISSTATSVVMVALTAYITIKVRFGR